MGGWMDEWMGIKGVLRIAYSNQKKDKQKQILQIRFSCCECESKKGLERRRDK